ncbi:beta-lactamase family protein [Myroides odoratimimus]|uniref:serine hydrolase domain-containing protein n=1 Tax=Myroides odoratimimus TaxID=76832 RepID=UPI002575A713|nr:serine hydrolase domain-containing protein [Myroides odoratimimus]MDM1395862.1 beta-lactamase family protein [Myroides odoratimimus]
MNTKILLLVLMLSSVVFGQEIQKYKLDHYLDEVSKNNTEAGSLSIFKKGEEVYHKDFGHDNLPDTSSDENKMYQIGSVTKLYTAVIIFKLIEEGKLELTTKLSDFYSDMPNADRITIKNLLDHSSGLGSYVVKNGEVWVTEKVTEQEILNLIKEQGVKFAPDTDRAYSNSAYYLLTKIIEKVTDKPYHLLINQYIVNPLQLKSTYSAKSMPIYVHKPYQFEYGKWVEMVDINPMNIIGVGDLTTTTKELNIFIYNLFQGKVITSASLESMLPKKIEGKYGRGIMHLVYDDVCFYGHGGDTLGTHTMLVYNPDDEVSIAYSSNAQQVPNEVFLSIVNMLYHKEYKLLKEKD